MSFKQKCTAVVSRGHQLRDDLATRGFKHLMLDECGSMSIDGLAKEAIAVLVLIIIFAIVPKIGMMVSGSLSNVGTVDANITKAWAGAPDGAALWTQMAGIIQIAAVILIVAVIIRAIYRFKQQSTD